MLQFFRRIRERSLSENRFSKYLIYAIGEIVLVVIGILIALQINNWNEYRLELKYQDAVLKEIKKGLASDIQRFRDNLEILQKVDTGITGIVRLMEKEDGEVQVDEFHESANKTVMDIKFNYNTGAYEGLKSTGLEKIQNAELRSNLINYYEVSLKAAQDEIQESSTFFEKRQEEILKQFNKDKVFETIFEWNQDSLISLNFKIHPEKILAHSLYPEYLTNVKWEGLDHRRTLNNLIQDSEKLIREINTELAEGN